MPPPTSRASHRPENALKRAEELLAVDNKTAALQQLHDIVTNKRYRSWQPVLERIMLRHVELVVEMKQARLAKDALLQFKNVCQNSNVASLEGVIRRLVELAQARVDSAQKSSEEKQQAVKQLADLEEGETPEEVLMASVTGEATKDRADRELVAPWLRFLWEVYRLALDVLRNNVKLEQLYHSTALQAFQFCIKYERRNEFRRLCDMLRLHLVNLAKYAHQANAVSLNNVESLQLHMETRFAQLSAAVQLELWQEASRTVDEMLNLMRQSRKPLRSSVMASYYDKLAQIFLVSENWLMHAFAFKRQYQKSASKLTPEERREYAAAAARRMASAVVLAALAAPLDSATPRSLVSLVDADTDGAGRNQRLAEYLLMTKAPTRDLLMRELTSRDILDNVHPETRELYRIFEQEFTPLTLCTKLASATEFMRSKPLFERYIRPLQEVALTRLVQQLSQIYRVVKLDTIAQLVTFETPERIETFLMERSKRGELSLRIDHITRTVVFDPAAVAGQGSTVRASLQADEYRTQLTTLAERLHTAVQQLAPTPVADIVARRRALAERVRQEVEAERAAILERRAIIEKMKDEAEQQKHKRDVEAMRERRRRMEREAEAERKRLAEESKRRELERIQKERLAIEKEQKAKIAAEMKRKSEAAGLKLKDIDLEQLDTEQLLAKQVEQLEAEKREMRARLTALAKRIDHTERAIRKEELPLLAEDYERHKQEDRRYYEEQAVVTRKAAEEQHKRDLAVRDRLARMVDDSRALREKILEYRRADFERKRADALARLEAEKARRREEFRKAKEEERRLLQAAEEKRRQLEEERRQRQEEEARLQQEELERQEAAAAAAAAAAPPAAEKQQPAAAPPTGKYIPPSLRATMTGAGGAGDSAAAAAPAPARPSREPPVPSLLRGGEPGAADKKASWRDQFPASAPPIPSLISGGGGGASAPSSSSAARRSNAPPVPSLVGGGAAAAPAARDAAAAPKPASTGKYIPPNLRRQMENQS